MKKTKKLVPKIRFKEFMNSEYWKKRKFTDMVTRISSTTNNIFLPRIEYEDIISGRGTLNKDIYQKESIKYGIAFEEQDILFGKLRPYLKNWLLSEFKGIAVGDFWVFRTTDTNSKFIYSLIQTNRYQKIANLSIGTKMPRSDWNIVSSTDFIIPKRINEQEKIGRFFEHLDNLINLQQLKLAKIKDLKSAYLSDLFPKEGEKYPKLRFEGFTEPWQSYELFQIARIIGGGTPSTSNAQYWNGNIDWYSPTEIGNNIYAYDSVKKITRLGLENSSANILPKDSTILFTSRAGIGDMAILKQPAATNQGFQSLILNDDVDVYFIYSMGYLIKEYAENNASGSTFMEISGKELSKMPLRVPSNKEQIKIGCFFNKLDKKIELQEQRLNKLEKIKQAYLNEMFV